MRKFMTALLALVMLLSVAMPAFAAAATSPAELTEDASSVDIPIIYNIEYTAGEFTPEVKDKIDSENRSYRVVVSWTATPGIVEVPCTYKWDAANAQYVVDDTSGDKTRADVRSDASADVKIQNYSNAKIWYGVTSALEYKTPDIPKALLKPDWSTWNGAYLSDDGYLVADKLARSQFTLDSASAGVTNANQAVDENQIPQASGTFNFAMGTPDYQLVMNDVQEKVATLTVSFYTSNPYA